MDKTEIYLNKLSTREDIYSEIAKKLGNTCVSGRDELTGALMNISDDVCFRLYVSSEDTENAAVSEAAEVFSECGKNNPHISMEIIEDEFLNLIDSEARLTSVAKPRSLVHRDGELHPAVHIWIIKRKDMGIYVLLQKRSHDKNIHPDCYDVSAAGHVAQGEEFRSTAVRETAEELGLKIHGSRLELIGLHRNQYISGDINDNELRAIYLCREEVDADRLVLQSAEVSDVCWAEIDELLAVMHDGDFKHCLDLEELAMIKKAVF
ncbi:MAG: NUDIX domain-containing protein [Ruminococcus sp.]|nr:NUDIX domain-containing protein [Ruminococcus sp.]